MQMQVVDTTGKSTGKISLPNEIFAMKASPKLLAQAIRVYLINQRQGTVKVKSRGQVKGSNRKIWRQKGTGRARHGDRYAPIFVGGGVAHGPTGNKQPKLKFSKRMRRKALFSALTIKITEKKLIVIEGLEEVKPKTKIMNQVLIKLTNKIPEKVSIIIPENTDSVTRGARNIKGVRLLSAKKLNAYEVLNSESIILMKDAVGVIKETFLEKPQKPTRIKSSSEKKAQRKTTQPKLKTKKIEPEVKKKSTKTKTIRK